MRSEEIKRMAESTADAAFAVDGEGLVVAWNNAAESLFALPANEAMGRHCGDIVQGADECGEEPAVAVGEHRGGGGVHGGRVRPDQLAGGGFDRGGFANWRVPWRALRTAALADGAADRDRDGRRDRAVSTRNRLVCGGRSAVGFRPAAGDPSSTAGCGAVW